MKALSLTQPWATLVAIGAKRIETRSWGTAFRGELAIQATQGFPRDCQELCATEPFRTVLKAAGFTNTKELPRGAIVAVARLVGCVGTAHMDYVTPSPCPHEIAFGDYSFGRFAWLLDDVAPATKPILCKGALGLWEVPPSVWQALTTTRAVAAVGEAHG